MSQVKQVFPSNLRIEVEKPAESSVVEFKPNNLSALDGKMTERLYPASILKGMPMGLLLTLTYPENFEFTTNIAG